VSKSLGRPLRLSHADIVRWKDKVLPTASCHIWMGAIGSDGYGRFSIHNQQDGTRMLTPHQVAARLAFGPIPLGASLLHDCEVRLCCNTAPGHERIATQGENMRQAVARGRAVGPRPGRVDVRGKAGASRAIQAALRDAVDSRPAALARILAAVLSEGDPWRDRLPLFDVPRPTLHREPATVLAAVTAGGPDAGSRPPPPVRSWPLFGDGGTGE
jgi:hypothetical protein